jgi:hypothetical protein
LNLEELNNKLPNGFHDAKLLSIQLDYIARTATLHLSLWVGSMEAPPGPNREKYQAAILNLSGLCFCSIEPPDPGYPFLPKGKPSSVDGDPAKGDHFPSLPALSARLPEGAWCYRFFVVDWNAFIYVAAKDANISLVEIASKGIE